MIVDFAIEDDDRVTVIAAEGLVAALEIDDLQTDRAERYVPRLESPLLVRPAMSKRARDPVDNSAIYKAVPMSESRNPAQNAKSPFFKRRCVW